MKTKHVVDCLGLALLAGWVLYVVGTSGGAAAGLGFAMICGATLAAMVFLMSSSMRHRRGDGTTNRGASD
jgi:hypothetical protein